VQVGWSVDLRLMLGDFEPRFRQIEDLPFLDACRHRRRQIRPAMGATCCRVALDDVGLVHPPQRVAFVPDLSAAFLLGCAA
jgi:hypothetical protein